MTTFSQMFEHLNGNCVSWRVIPSDDENPNSYEGYLLEFFLSEAVHIMLYPHCLEVIWVGEDELDYAWFKINFSIRELEETLEVLNSRILICNQLKESEEAYAEGHHSEASQSEAGNVEGNLS